MDTETAIKEIKDTLDWERDNLHFLESSPRDEWTERNVKRKRITIQALKLAVEALQKQEPCEWCEGNTSKYFDVLWYDFTSGNTGARSKTRFCPFCGRDV